MQTIKFSLSVVYYKSQDMVYFSQLDIMHVYERALRRAGLPLYYTQGYKPHVKMSFKSALKLGVEGEEEVKFYFTKKITCSELSSLLLPQLPQGLLIRHITES
jgi:radical SAM-linked protein